MKKKICFNCFLFVMLLWAVSTVYAAEMPVPGQPKLISTVATGYDSVKINWTKAQGAVYYRVYYKVDGKWTRVGKTEGTSFEHKGSAKHPLVPGKTYQYTVKAFVNEDIYGKYDKKGISVKLPVPEIGTVENITVTCQDYNRMNISWNKANGAELYRVYIKKGNDWVKLGTTKGTAFTHKSSAKAPLAVGQYYTYTVRATKYYGGKEFKGNFNKLGVKGKVRPQTPVPVSVEMSGTDKTILKWKKAEGADKYFIFYKAEGQAWKELGSVKGDKTEYLHVSSAKAPLKAGTTYSYTVQAYNSNARIRSHKDEKGVSLLFMSSRYMIDQKVHQQAQAVIARITKPEMSTQQKLNACFSWIMISNYRPSMDPNIHEEDWEYKCAYEYLCTHTGNCYGFAYGFAALARELGYEPYVVHIPGVHCFVRINGGYWDNMHGGLRGVSYRPMPYSESQIALF